MVLDLSLMRNVDVNVDNHTVSFQGGCLWRDVDDALWPHGLATVGGTVSHTGVGGLILHGGFGILQGIYGLTIDVLESCEVVLADGSIVTASEKDNSDLFWGLRGAGSSFGVVTQFTSKVFPQGNVWALMAVFTADKLPQLVEFLNYCEQNTDGHQAAALMFTHSPPSPDGAPQVPVIMAQAAHLGPDAESKGPEFFASILKIDTLMKNDGVMPYPVLNKSADENAFPPGNRYLFGGANFTFPLKVSTAESIASQSWGFSKQFPGTGGEGSVAMLEWFPTGKVRSVDPTSMAFNNRGNYYNVGLVWTWGDESLDTKVREYNRSAQKAIRSLGYDDATLSDGVGAYLNYTTSEATSAESVFGSNTQRLKDLKEKYDPKNVFDKMWKISKESKAEPIAAPAAIGV